MPHCSPQCLLRKRVGESATSMFFACQQRWLPSLLHNQRISSWSPFHIIIWACLTFELNQTQVGAAIWCGIYSVHGMQMHMLCADWHTLCAIKCLSLAVDGVHLCWIWTQYLYICSVYELMFQKAWVKKVTNIAKSPLDKLLN